MRTLLLIALTFTVVKAFGQAGMLDPTFSGDGVVYFDLGGKDYGYAMALQSDGKIVVGGSTGPDNNNYVFALSRFNPNGSVDSMFGTNGIVTHGFGTDVRSRIYAVAIQDDGKILVAGSTYHGFNDTDWALARYTVDGTLDNSFGIGGKLTLDLGGVLYEARSIALQPNGKILVGGFGSVGGFAFALVRFNSNGQVDATFGNGGLVTTQYMTESTLLTKLTVQPDGKIVAVGSTHYSTLNDAFMITRYNANGGVDASFNGSGMVIDDVGPYDDGAGAVAVQPDGKILVGGYKSMTGAGTNDDVFAIVRHNEDGTTDNSFGNAGTVTMDFGAYSDAVQALLVQPDGKIIAVGYGSVTFCLVRYHYNGVVDSSFGTSGKVQAPNGSAYGAALQPDGKIMAAGYHDAGFPFFALARYQAYSTPLALGFQNTDTVGCQNLCIANINLTVTGGVWPYTYAWSTGATSQNLVNACPGWYAVTVTDSNGDSLIDSLNVNVTTAVCMLPLSPSSTNISSTGASVQWTGSACAVKYRVRIKNMSTGQTNLYFVNAPDTTKALTGLSPNTLYKVQVRSQCSTNGSILSSWSSPVYFTTLTSIAIVCIPPTNPSATATSNSTATINWNGVTGANGYQLRYRMQGTPTWTPVVINNGLATSTNLTSLQPNTTYQYQLRTKCSTNPLTWSNYSAIQIFSTPLRLGENETAIDVDVYPNPSSGVFALSLQSSKRSTLR